MGRARAVGRMTLRGQGSFPCPLYFSRAMIYPSLVGRTDRLPGPRLGDLTMYELTSLEKTARAMADAYHKKVADAGRDLSIEESLVLKVFIIKAWSALDVPQIAKLAAALATEYSNYTLPSDVLTRMVRGKFLRSRMLSGVRHYEVNFSEV